MSEEVVKGGFGDIEINDTFFRNLNSMESDFRSGILALLKSTENPSSVSMGEILEALKLKKIIENMNFVSVMCAIILESLTEEVLKDDRQRPLFLPLEGMTIHYFFYLFSSFYIENREKIEALFGNEEENSNFSAEQRNDYLEKIEKFSAYEKDNILIIRDTPYSIYDVYEKMLDEIDNINGIFMTDILDSFFEKISDTNSKRTQLRTYRSSVENLKKTMPLASDILREYRKKEKT